MKVRVSVRKFDQMMCRLNITYSYTWIVRTEVRADWTFEACLALWQKLFNYDYAYDVAAADAAADANAVCC